MIKAVMDAIGNRAIVKQRREYIFNPLLHRGEPGHIQIGFLLTREGGGWQIFCGRRGTHRHGQFALGRLTHGGIGGSHRGFERGLQRRIEHPLSNLTTGGI